MANAGSLEGLHNKIGHPVSHHKQLMQVPVLEPAKYKQTLKHAFSATSWTFMAGSERDAWDCVIFYMIYIFILHIPIIFVPLFTLFFTFFSFFLLLMTGYGMVAGGSVGRFSYCLIRGCNLSDLFLGLPVLHLCFGCVCLFDLVTVLLV